MCKCDFGVCVIFLQAKSPKREAHKKKRYLRNLAKNGGESGASGTEKSEVSTGEASGKSAGGSADVSCCP